MHALPLPVEIVDYCARWLLLYEEARARIVAAIGNQIVRIDHAGSTAVPGLAAKPVIDILVGVSSWESAKSTIGPLTADGWEYAGEFGIALRHYFRKYDVCGRCTHHLHMLEVSGTEWLDHVLFRDYLRSNPEAAAEYAVLKRALASRGLASRDYTEAKSSFIRSALQRARTDVARD